MATMYPQRLPSSGKSNAERKLFDLLRDHLSNDYTVIWSIDWTVSRPASSGGGVRESEIDFLVLHPDKGILVLEVKGGGVGYDGALHEWYSIDDDRRRHKIKDPFEQAKDGKYTLIRELTKQVPLPWLRIACQNSVFGHAAVFPDIDGSRIANRPTNQMRSFLTARICNPLPFSRQLIERTNFGDVALLSHSVRTPLQKSLRCMRQAGIFVRHLLTSLRMKRLN